MITKSLIPFLILVLFISCRQTTQSIDISTIPIPDSIPSQNASAITQQAENYPEIYSFLQELIKAKDLDTTFGLFINPALACNNGDEDYSFLKTLIKKKTKRQKKQNDSILSGQDSLISVFTLSPDIFPNDEEEEYLTKEDVDYMPAQKPNAGKFRWDNSKLGFDLANKENFYNISIPLFTKDHKIAVVMIESLCRGLCGTGNNYIYIRKKNKWVSNQKKGFGWVH